QRLGADAPGPAGAVQPAPADLPPRLRCLRPRQGGLRVDGPGGERTSLLPLRHEPAGQRQRRPRRRGLRHRAVVRGEGRADRVPEDVLIIGGGLDGPPGPGRYRAFGVLWEEGGELPIGFTKKVVGFPRVANNCAVCHTASYRTREEETPTYVPAGPNHASNVQALLRFFATCAADPRFNADDILAEIALVERLSWFDKLAYRYLIIPRVKQELLRRRDQFAWMDRPGWPHWGPGRDDPMNLTKYFMTHLPVDDTVGNADFPAIWNLKVRDGKALQWDGSTPLTLAVLTDSALGLGARPTDWFRTEMRWLEGYLRNLPAPKYPFPVDAALAASGKSVFGQACASCHAPGPGSRLGTLIDIAEIGTDRNRLDAWTEAGANAANRVRTELGVNYGNMTKTNGYIAVPLDGIWLRAPY